ncbi:MAG: 3-deoxy-manno-octulosonate cytidylyltransferase [Fimbriimonadaceae bacterium]|nr:3-deoxy-manno-octulosonate cytidylyltransferase [Fimbriimonadaceae bacterium]
MGSTRFPGKPLCDLMGKPMVQWVVEAAREADIAEAVIVATPDPEIVDACAEFGAQAMLTDANHPSGTDRLAEVAESVDAAIYVNVQGDEPLIRPETIRACVQPMFEDPSIPMASVYCTCPEAEYADPSVVKVVTDAFGDALYFSRYAVPFARNPRTIPVKKHIGLYAYRKEPLREFETWRMSPLERAESLEQLRFLHHGVRIRMSEAASAELAVDTPEQAERVREILKSRK